MHSLIRNEIQKLANLLVQIQQDANIQHTMLAIAEKSVSAIKAGKKVLFAGNGGSAADSQHLAAELVSRLRYNRPGIASMALTTDTSALTAIGNDYSFEYIFARQIEAIGQAGDVFIGISTSGKSPNILQALATAKNNGLICIAFSGQNHNAMSAYCDLTLSIPSTETPKIQECHIMCGHIICALIEEALFSQYNPEYKKSEEVA